MYIVKKNNGYTVSDSETRAIVKINSPIIEENGAELILSQSGCCFSEGFGFSCSEAVEDKGRGLFLLTRTYTNETNESRSVKLILEVVTEYEPEHYMIPCVSYNGNYWGEGKEPKGMLAENGEPWIHSYDRTPIPSCSLTETREIAFSLFADGSTPESLISSVSLRPAEGGRISHRIYWPVTEAPFTYYENDKYNERLDTTLTFAPGQSVTVGAYLLFSVPKWENYGITETLDRALELFPFRHELCRSTDEIWKLGIDYSKFLLREHRGKLLFSTGCVPYNDGLKMAQHYEVGWCGMNIMNSRMQILEYLRTGEKKLLMTALAVCDNWVEKQSDSGLVLAHYEWYTEGKNWNYKPRDLTKSWASNVDYVNGWLPETCNTGWAADEMLKVWKLLHDNGIEKPEYRVFGEKILNFFCDHYSPEYAFGKAWHFDGTCEEPSGTIGAFVTMALCDGYRITGEKRYLDFAIRSLDFYMKRDLANFVCTAGAIDCTCVDKETAGPIIIAALDLYDITKEARFLEYAVQASYYFASWMYIYDVNYGKEAEFTQYGYFTAGSTYVSVQHPALDQWGELMCCEWLRLADYTGDERWRTRAKMMWYNAVQCIADEKNRVYHGKSRPIGSQNEAFYHARWGHRKNCNERGHLNDWLVSWVNVFRLNVLDRLTSVNGYPDRHALDK